MASPKKGPSNKKKKNPSDSPGSGKGKKAKKAPEALPGATSDIPPGLRKFLSSTSTPKGFTRSKKLTSGDLREILIERHVSPPVPLETRRTRRLRRNCLMT
ncbi:MAG: hypothetical protein P8188_18245 [Gemmatimonadota bacterium]